MKKIRIPFWMQIAAILLAGILASGAAFWIAQEYMSNRQTEELEKHTVTFAYLDGTVIEIKEVTHGKGVFPPELTDEGVFRGWSNGFNAVVADVEAHPVYHSITENNLFHFDSVYVQEGNEFTLDICVGGHVSVSSGELTLEYDAEVLEFLDSKDMVKCTVSESTKGELVICFNSDTVIKTETLLSQLRFRAKEKDAYATEVILKASNIKVVAEGQELPADCATINNKVFFIQEVG